MHSQTLSIIIEHKERINISYKLIMNIYLDKKTDTIEKVLLTYNEEMDELFEDDVRPIGGKSYATIFGSGTRNFIALNG
jgi:hypothetical protein